METHGFAVIEFLSKVHDPQGDNIDMVVFGIPLEDY